MTKSQLRRLNTLTGQVEALQGAIVIKSERDRRAQECVAKAKNALMDAIREAERPA